MKNLAHSKIAFIGAGKMAEAIIKGLCGCNIIQPHNIIISDKKKARIKAVNEHCRVKAVEGNASAVAGASVVILAVKPQDMDEVLKEIAPYVTKFQLIISIAAGITLDRIQKKLKRIPIVRAMPNNPALVGAGLTALCSGLFAKEAHLKIADSVFRTVGETVVVNENMMDAITALSGSGPAFVYLFIEALISGATALKLPKATARRLALEMIQGSLLVVKDTHKPLKQLVDMVTSKGGTTEAGIKVLKKYKFKKAIEATLLSAFKRSKELSK